MCPVTAQLLQNISPLLSSFIMVPVFSCLLGQCYTALSLLLTREGSPHKQTSCAGNSPDKKLFVCNEKMPTLKSLHSCLLQSVINVTAGRWRLQASRKHFFPRIDYWVQLFRRKALIMCYLRKTENKQKCKAIHTNSAGPKCVQWHPKLPGLNISANRTSCTRDWLDRFTV